MFPGLACITCRWCSNVIHSKPTNIGDFNAISKTTSWRRGEAGPQSTFAVTFSKCFDWTIRDGHSASVCKKWSSVQCRSITKFRLGGTRPFNRLDDCTVVGWPFFLWANLSGSWQVMFTAFHATPRTIHHGSCFRCERQKLLWVTTEYANSSKKNSPSSLSTPDRFHCNMLDHVVISYWLNPCAFNEWKSVLFFTNVKACARCL